MQAVKVVLCGDVCVGKSAIFTYIQTGELNPYEQSTIQATFAAIKVKVDDEMEASGQREIKLQLWDTAGDDKLKHITRNYYRGASAALVVYDVTNRQTLDAAAGWIQSIRDSAEQGCFIVLVGNKVDLIEQIEVMKSEG